MNQTLFILLLLITSCTLKHSSNKEQIETLFKKYKHKFALVKNIDATDVLKLKKKDDHVLVDVREPHEQKVSMIPGAISIQEFEKQQKRKSEKTYIFYCTIGVRSGIKAQEYQKKGYKVYNFKGSILNWAHSGLDFVHKGKPTKKVHTYSQDWDFLPKGYQAVF